MRSRRKEPAAPVFGGYPVDPCYDDYMKKCLKKYPYLYEIIDCIVDSKIAALRAEMYQMYMCQPMYPSMPCPGPGTPYPGIAGPAGGPQFRPGYPMM